MTTELVIGLVLSVVCVTAWFRRKNIHDKEHRRLRQTQRWPKW